MMQTGRLCSLCRCKRTLNQGGICSGCLRDIDSRQRKGEAVPRCVKCGSFRVSIIRADHCSVLHKCKCGHRWVVHEPEKKEGEKKKPY